MIHEISHVVMCIVTITKILSNKVEKENDLNF